MSKKVKYSVQLLMVLFISALSIQKFAITWTTYDRLDLATIITSVLFLGVALLIKKSEFKIYYEWFDLAYYFFLLSVLISAIINPGFRIPNFLRAFLINYLVLNLTVRNIPELLNAKTFLMSVLIPYIPMVVTHLVNKPNIFQKSYQGIFKHPNTFGLFMITITIVLFSITFSKIYEKKYFKSTFYCLLSFFSFYLLVISGSRTAFLAVLLSLLLVSVIYLVELFKKIDKKQRNLFVLLSTVALILIYLLVKDTFIIEGLKENILNKFAYQIQKSRLFSGRERIWKYYLANSYLFKSDIQSVRNTLGLDPHNTFVEIISRFGQAAGFFYISYWLLSIKNLVVYSINEIGKDSYVPFYIMAIVGFVGASMMEIVAYHPLMYIAMYASSRVVVNKNKNGEKSLSLSEIKSKIVS